VALAMTASTVRAVASNVAAGDGVANFELLAEVAG